MKDRSPIPGLPGTGHVTPTGFWHPGKRKKCQKCNDDDNATAIAGGATRRKLRLDFRRFPLPRRPIEMVITSTPARW